jgi:hypothetical protein
MYRGTLLSFQVYGPSLPLQATAIFWYFSQYTGAGT